MNTLNEKKLTPEQAHTIVNEANAIYNASETQLPNRIEAWCIANFNPNKPHQAEEAFELILEAATSGEGNKFCLDMAAIILKKHQTVRH